MGATRRTLCLALWDCATLAMKVVVLEYGNREFASRQ